MPYHAAQNYIAKLIKAGRRVAICDQTSEPQPGKIVKREITQIITAGTVSELDLLEAKRQNYLGADSFARTAFSVCLCRSEHGRISARPKWKDCGALRDELARIVAGGSAGQRTAECAVRARSRRHARRMTAYAFLPDQARFTLCEHFKVKSLDGFGCGDMPAADRRGRRDHPLSEAATAAESRSPHVVALRRAGRITCCSMPRRRRTSSWSTSRGARDMSLLAALDRTVTPMGGRKAAQLDSAAAARSRASCEHRQQMIADLLHEPDLLGSLRACAERRSATSSAPRAAEPGLGKRARSGRAADVAGADPGAEAGAAEAARPARVWRPIT